MLFSGCWCSANSTNAPESGDCLRHHVEKSGKVVVGRQLGAVRALVQLEVGQAITTLYWGAGCSVLTQGSCLWVCWRRLCVGFTFGGRTGRGRFCRVQFLVHCVILEGWMWASSDWTAAHRPPGGLPRHYTLSRLVEWYVERSRGPVCGFFWGQTILQKLLWIAEPSPDSLCDMRASVGCQHK